jgi:hypothetical protein
MGKVAILTLTRNLCVREWKAKHVVSSTENVGGVIYIGSSNVMVIIRLNM